MLVLATSETMSPSKLTSTLVVVPSSLGDEAFKSFIKNSNNVFSIMSTNIASIRSKYDELKIFTEELLDYDFKFDVICIQESWLGETDDPLFFSIDS